MAPNSSGIVCWNSGNPISNGLFAIANDEWEVPRPFANSIAMSIDVSRTHPGCPQTTS